MGDRCSSVRDCDGRAPTCNGIDGVKNLSFAFQIDVCSGFIKQKDWGVFDERPGKCDALCFTAREGQSFVADAGIQALGKPRQKIVEADGAQCREDILIARFGIGDQDVRAQRVREKVGCLFNNGDLRADPLQGYLRDINAIDEDGSLAGTVVRLDQA